MSFMVIDPPGFSDPGTLSQQPQLRRSLAAYASSTLQPTLNLMMLARKPNAHAVLFHSYSIEAELSSTINLLYFGNVLIKERKPTP